jgi:putative transposase
MKADTAKVVDIVADRKCIRLDELIEEAGSADSVFFAIARQEVYFDLEDQLLCKPESAYVCSDPAYAKAISVAQSSAVPVELNTVSLAVGASVNWDGATHRVINAGEGNYTLQHPDGRIARIRDEEVSILVRDGVMRSVPGQETDDEAVARIMMASVDSINRAILRAQLIQAYEESRLPEGIKARTVRFWKREWKKAQEKYGNGFIGLLDKIFNRGSGKKISDDQLAMLELSIDEDYCNGRKTTQKKAHEKYIGRCKIEGGPPVSYTTYGEHIRKRREYDLELRRSGRRAAYQIRGPLNDGSQEISDLYPPHGDRAWEFAHIDHTPLDTELVSAFTGKPLGQPYLTMMIDAYTRMVLAFVISFERPSSRVIMLVMRECVRRHGRLPAKIVVDRGAEFMGTYFEVLAARKVITKIERVAGEPRGGAPMERAFGRNDTQFIHDLLGNTQARKMGRSMSSSHDPAKHAVWTPDAFEKVLAEFLYEIQPQTIHLGILEKPAERLARSLRESGNRIHTHIPYDRVFYVGTLLTPDTPTRSVRNCSVKVNHIYYTSPELARVRNKTKVSVKFDPYDIAHIYAYIEHEWVRLTTTHHLVREFTERQIRLAHMEIMALAVNAQHEYLNVSELILKFLADVSARERMLMAQRRDRTQEMDAGVNMQDPHMYEPVSHVKTHSIPSRSLPTTRRFT